MFYHYLRVTNNGLNNSNFCSLGVSADEIRQLQTVFEIGQVQRAAGSGEKQG